MTGRARRWGPWVVLVLVLAVGLAVGAEHHARPETVEQRTLSIAGQVRCPVCQGESAAQSGTAAAQSIRRVIHADLEHGRTDRQILRQLEDDYGATILESPPTSGISLWIWILPGVVVAAAVAGLVYGFRRWRRPATARTVEVAPADEDLVRQALTAHRLARAAPGGHGPRHGAVGQASAPGGDDREALR